LKAYEKFYELTDLYDTKNWSWAASLQYEIVRDTLKVATVQIQTKIPAEQTETNQLFICLTTTLLCLTRTHTAKRSHSMKPIFRCIFQQCSIGLFNCCLYLFVAVE
jgi:hypothetical protein